MTRSDVILSGRSIFKRYGGLEVLSGVNIDVEKGSTKVIIGPSGSGKSTLLRILGLLEEPDRGEVYFEGVNVYREKVDLNRLRSKIGFVFQEPSLFRHLTALDNVALGLRVVLKMDKEKARRKAMEILEMVHLERWAHHYPAQLSGGQQQRVGIARALAMDPDIILFDEPTASLDIELTWEVIDVMKELSRQGITMLVVTHEIGFAKEVADWIYFMDHGRIIEENTPRELLHNPKSRRAKVFLRRLLEGI